MKSSLIFVTILIYKIDGKYSLTNSYDIHHQKDQNQNEFNIALYQFLIESPLKYDETMKLLLERFTNKIDDCAKLKQLYLMPYNIHDNITKVSLSNCSALRVIDMNFISETNVQGIMKDMKEIIDLVVKNSIIPIVTRDLLRDAEGLVNLTLQRNCFKMVNSDAFDGMARLKLLDLSENEFIKPSDVIQSLTPLGSLEYLSFRSNSLFDFCTMYDDRNKPLPPIANVSTLILANTATHTLCFGLWKNLKFVNFNGNTLSYIGFNDIPRYTEHNVEISLHAANSISFVEILDNEKSYYEAMKKFPKTAKVKNVTFTNMGRELDCDCKLGWFAKTVRNLPNLHIEGVKCLPQHKRLLDVPIDTIECDKFWEGKCACRRFWGNGSVSANCSNQMLKEIPNINGVYTIFADSNHLQTLSPSDFPNTLKYADLSHNKISTLSISTTKQMFSMPDRYLKLAGNPIDCGCNNKMFIEMLQKHKAKIIDYESIFCINDGLKLLKDVVPEDTCTLKVSYVMASIIVAFVLEVIFRVFNKYRSQIKFFMYSRGLISKSRFKDVDDDYHPFDVFLSFCSEEDEFVNESILPVLKDFRVCIHYRNWLAGETISTQIALSVNNSKRTVLIISKAFLKSSWGLMEFRMAYMRARNEGKQRITAVLLDDIERDPDIDGELREYLSHNTYLKWGDPWFFQKLQYSLPEINNIATNETIETGVNAKDFKIVVDTYRPGVYKLSPDDKNPFRADESQCIDDILDDGIEIDGEIESYMATKQISNIHKKIG